MNCFLSASLSGLSFFYKTGSESLELLVKADVLLFTLAVESFDFLLPIPLIVAPDEGLDIII